MVCSKEGVLLLKGLSKEGWNYCIRTAGLLIKNNMPKFAFMQLHLFSEFSLESSLIILALHS